MIQDFISNLSKRGTAKPSRFLVEILTVPALLKNTPGASDFQKDLKFFCCAVDLPGSQIMTNDNRIYDLPQKYAYQKVHDDIVLTVRMDKDHSSKLFFDGWIDSIYNRDTGNVFYKSSYVGEIKVSPVSDSGDCPYSIIYEECFPFQVGNVSYSWEATNQVLQFTVTLCFTHSKTVAGESLFSSPAGARGISNVSIQDEESPTKINIPGFDVMNIDSTSLLKSNQFSSISSAFVDGFSQKLSMNSSLFDAALKKYF